MDDDAIETSEYYKDPQSFQAQRKGKSKHDSADASGEGLSKQNYAVKLLPVDLESSSDGLIMKITANEKDTNDILQTFR